MKYTAFVDGQKLDIELLLRDNGVTEARVGHTVYPLEIRETSTDTFWLNWNNLSIEVAVIRSNGTYTVALNGKRFEIDLSNGRSLRRSGAVSQTGIVPVKARMPGKIVKILVSEGDEVQRNQGLLVMEAMKMQNEIQSPKIGRVRRIAVQEGATVGANELLAEVE